MRSIRNPSERIDELIAELTDWRGRTSADIRCGLTTERSPSPTPTRRRRSSEY